MINLKLGTEKTTDGRSFILTKQGLSGHAVWGSYTQFEVGHYYVVFDIGMTDDQQGFDDDICAIIDVASNYGKNILASAPVYSKELKTGGQRIGLKFVLATRTTLECRVFVNGRIPLLIEASPRPILLSDDELNIDSAISTAQFPDSVAPTSSMFFNENKHQLRKLHQNGVRVNIVDEDVILRVSGVYLYARQIDDIRFIREVYFSNTYNFVAPGEICVIDIGMNIGLSSLFFASKDNVKEVHSYEPFKSTFERGIANIALNQKLAPKISPNNFGLADKDEELTILLSQEYDSGCFSTRSAVSGRPVDISVRNAAVVLGPIIDCALAKGRKVIAKVDCEGSEFPIFNVLDASGILEKISAFMVEWHRGAGEKTQDDLIAPLLRQGFIVFDITPSGKSGNGFFYAVRAG